MAPIRGLWVPNLLACCAVSPQHSTRAFRSRKRSETVDIMLSASGDGLKDTPALPPERTRTLAGNKNLPLDTVLRQRICCIVIATADVSATGIQEGELRRFFLDGISIKNPLTHWGKRQLGLVQCCIGLNCSPSAGWVPSCLTHAIPFVGQVVISAPRPTVQNISSAIRATCRRHQVVLTPQQATIAAMKAASIAGFCFFVFTDRFLKPFASIRTSGCESRGGMRATARSKFTALLADSTTVVLPGLFLATCAKKASGIEFDFVASSGDNSVWSLTYFLLLVGLCGTRRYLFCSFSHVPEFLYPCRVAIP